MVEAGTEKVFRFFSDASNLQAITPGFLRFRVLTPMLIEMGAGTGTEYALSLFGLPLRWRTLITTWKPGVCFVDERESGRTPIGATRTCGREARHDDDARPGRVRDAPWAAGPEACVG